MKYIRVDEDKRVAEIFPYNPFEWIVDADGVPNEEFLADCRRLGDGVEVNYGWIENADGSYSPPDAEGQI